MTCTSWSRKDVHVGEGKKPRWTIASARQNLPELVTLAAHEPQDIYRRDTLVARVVAVGPDAPVVREKPSAAELLAAIQRVCEEENYDLPVAPRLGRPNAMLAVLNGMPAPNRRKSKSKSKRR